jgi:multidrug efflux system membrane fusion protein
MHIAEHAMGRRPIWVAFFFSLASALATAGCGKLPAEVAAPEVPALPVSEPIQRQITDYVDFTGRTDAVQSVNIIPRVTGYLMKMPFTEGAEVKGPKDGKPGDLLFEIDPRPYQAQFDQAQGQVYLNEARVKEAKADNSRARELAKTPGAIAQQDLDRYQAAEEEAIASVQAAKASLEVFKLNLNFCQVTAPIDGQVSRYYLTLGNLVNQDQTLLTTVVSLDPMYVYFDMDEPTVLRIRTAINDGRIKRPQDGVLPVLIGLQNKPGYPYEGRINFVNNQVNSATGSISVRGVVQNPKPDGGARLLSPGMFARIRLPIGQPHPALLVIDRALGSDQGLKYLYVLDANNTVEYRRVETGALQEDGLRVITSGLQPNDRVIVGGIQQARPKMKIRPDPTPMPTLGQSTDTDSKPGDSSKPRSGSDDGAKPPAGGSDGGKPDAGTGDTTKPLDPGNPATTVPSTRSALPDTPAATGPALQSPVPRSENPQR